MYSMYAYYIKMYCIIDKRQLEDWALMDISLNECQKHMPEHRENFSECAFSSEKAIFFWDGDAEAWPSPQFNLPRPAPTSYTQLFPLKTYRCNRWIYLRHRRSRVIIVCCFAHIVSQCFSVLAELFVVYVTATVSTRAITRCVVKTYFMISRP